MIPPASPKGGEKESIPDTNSTHASPIPGLDSTRAKNLRTEFSFGLRNMASVYQRIAAFASRSALKEKQVHSAATGDELAPTRIVGVSRASYDP